MGGFAVELAVRRGLRVAAIAGAADEDLVRGFGATWFVPRDVERLGAAVRALVPGGVDGAVDAAVMGGAEVLGAVRNRGAYTTLGPVPSVPLRGIRTTNTWITADAERLAELSRLADSATGGLTLRVAETYALSDAEAAYQRLARGPCVGGWSWSRSRRALPRCARFGRPATRAITSPCAASPAAPTRARGRTLLRVPRVGWPARA